MSIDLQNKNDFFFGQALLRIPLDAAEAYSSLQAEAIGDESYRWRRSDLTPGNMSCCDVCAIGEIAQ